MSLQLEQEMGAVLKPVQEARGLPNACYTSEALFRREREVVMAPTWSCIGFASDLPEPGYARPVDFMGLPLVVIRGRDDVIRVFHNVCSHRGMLLVQQAGPVQTLLRCQYHSWAYDLKGALKATPHVGGVNVNRSPEFSCADHGLKPVRTAVWMDLVFVNLSGDAPAFEAHIEPLLQRWAPFLGKEGLSLLRTSDSSRELCIEVNCNWKLAVENYCEAYHLPWVHPGLNSYSRLEDHYNITFGDYCAGQGSLAYRLAETAGTRLPRLPGWPADRLEQAEYVALFPNVLLGIQADHAYAIVLEAVGVEKTLEHLRVMYVGEGATHEDYDASRAAVEASWRVVFNEDIAAVEGMQKGRYSSAFGGGLFTPALDYPTWYFHQWVARQWEQTA